MSIMHGGPPCVIMVKEDTYKKTDTSNGISYSQQIANKEQICDSNDIERKINSKKDKTSRTCNLCSYIARDLGKLNRHIKSKHDGLKY